MRASAVSRARLERPHRGRAALAFTLATASATALAERGTTDPTLPQRLRIGPPAGFWPMYRGDGARTGRIRTALPTTPAVITKIPLFADLATGPAVDDRGRLIVATRDAKLVEIEPSGRVAWSLALDTPVVIGPVIQSDGTRVVVTRDGVVSGISASGEPAFATPLAPARGPVRAEPLPTRDGATIIALGPFAVKLGAHGAHEATVELEEIIAAVTETDRGVFLTTESGQVFEWKPPGAARSIGSFGGKPTSEVVAPDASRLLTVVRNTVLVELGLRDGERGVVADVAPDAIADSAAVTPSGEIRLATRTGLLLGYRDARESFRHAIAAPSSMPSHTFTDAGLPPLVDPTGATASITPAGMLAIALPSGDVRTVPISDCGLPAALVPAGERRLAVFCRLGFIAIAGELTRPAATRLPYRPPSH